MATHDETISSLRRLATEIDRTRIASAFVASTLRAPDFWRTPLLAVAVAERVPEHAFEPWSANRNLCATCGGMTSGRYEGPPSPGMYSVGYIATMVGLLEDAMGSLANAPLPTDDECARFTRLLARIHTLGAKEGASKLSAAWGRAERALGDRDARDLVLETLAVCGVLDTPTHPGLTTRWTDHEERGAFSAGEVFAPLSVWRAGSA